VDPKTNTVYVTTGDPGNSGSAYADALVALNATDVTKVKTHWQVPKSQEIADDDFGATPTLFTNGTGAPEIVAGNNNGKTYLFNRNTLAHGPVWTFQTTTGRAIAPCAFDGRYLYIAAGPTAIAGASVYGSIRAFNPTTLHFVWQRSAYSNVFAAPAAANGVVVVGNTGHSLLVLSAATGQTLRSFSFSAGFYGAPAIANGVVYVGNVNHYVYAFKDPGSAPVAPGAASAGGATGTAHAPMLLGTAPRSAPGAGRPSL
jgi:outer membrane protein assembly factor BamB